MMTRKSNRFHRLFLLVLLFTQWGCSLFGTKDFGTDLKIHTSPDGADVYVYSAKDERYQHIGKTPFVLSKVDDIKDKANLDVPVLFMIEKPGYVPEHIGLDDIASAKFNLSLNLKRIEFWTDPTDENSSAVVHIVGKKFQNIYRLIRATKMNEALNEVDSLLKAYPRAAILHDIKGSIFVLLNKKSEAIAEYERSLQIRKDNPEAEKAIQFLKGN